VAFAYPTVVGRAVADEVERHSQLLAGLLLGGGFLYLRRTADTVYEVVGARVMGKRNSDDALHFWRPRKLSKVAKGLCRPNLAASGMMRRVSYEALKELGIREFCFVPPGFLPVPDEAKTGFVYLWADTAQRHDCVFWIRERGSGGFEPLAYFRDLRQH